MAGRLDLVFKSVFFGLVVVMAVCVSAFVLSRHRGYEPPSHGGLNATQGELQDLSALRSSITEAKDEKDFDKTFDRLVAAGPDARAPLEELAGDKRPAVRCRAVAALGKLGDRDGLDAILRRFSDSAPDVQIAALAATVNLYHSVLESARRIKPEARQRAAMEQARRLRGEALVHISRCLNDQSARIRATAARTIADLGDLSRAPQLVDLLRGHNRGRTEDERLVTRAAIEALTSLARQNNGKEFSPPARQTDNPRWWSRWFEENTELPNLP